MTLIDRPLLMTIWRSVIRMPWAQAMVAAASLARSPASAVATGDDSRPTVETSATSTA
jgi:hypothetical protein